ncbi:MAG: polysaccharide biosynthesis protein [Clostridia bacterium]|nr:polysaccharide biosynthesis protein [Clostridia bacterium]
MKSFLNKHRRLVVFLNDAFCVLLGYLIAIILVYEKTTLPEIIFTTVPLYGLVMIACYMISFAIFRTNSILWSYANMRNFTTLVSACATGAVITYAVEVLINAIFDVEINVTLRMNILSFVTVTNVILVNRIIVKFIREQQHKKREKPDLPTLLIVGAGSAAELCIQEINSRSTYNIVGLIDDQQAKQGCFLGGVKVLGDSGDIGRICKENKIDEILIAIPSLEHNKLADLVEKCEATGVKTKIIPQEGMFVESTSESITSKARDIQIEDMLYRDPVELENEKIGAYIQNHTVIVTGGGGSIGSEICRQVIKYKPAKLVILDNYENNAYELMLELKNNYPGANVSVIIATIRDKIAIDEVFAKVRPEIVFHAAAHKHVPLMEDTPKEAVKNNILGTFNVAKASIKYGVKRFIMISTDKAVNPTNIMGATKRVCEMMVQTFNDKERTEFVAVRFGNVLGSNGSVIPIFKQQIKDGGPVKVTHKDITRYFMTIPEAASLVLQAGVYANSGEVFVLDMGKPIKIYELAEKMIKLMGYTPGKDMKIEIVGLRPGEKLYEELYMSSEDMISTRHKRIYVAKPVNIDKEEFYNKILDMTEKIDSLPDEEIKKRVAEITGTYKYEH